MRQSTARFLSLEFLLLDLNEGLLIHNHLGTPYIARSSWWGERYHDVIWCVLGGLITGILMVDSDHVTKEPTKAVSAFSMVTPARDVRPNT